MKICWNYLEGIKLTRNGVFLKNNRSSYIYRDRCKKCSEPYLTLKHKPSDFCDRSCALSGENHPGYRKALTTGHKKKLSVAFMGENNHFYGKTHSEEVKDILREKARGRKPSDGVRKKMSKSRMGKRIHSEKYKKHLSEKFLGSNNPQWKGGISCEPYCFEWSFKEFKAFIKERDGNVCMNTDCRANSTRLIIHHIDYVKKNCQPDNLIAVCNSCNSRANKDREWHTDFYRTIMNKKYGYVYGEVDG